MSVKIFKMLKLLAVYYVAAASHECECYLDNLGEWYAAVNGERRREVAGGIRQKT